MNINTIRNVLFVTGEAVTSAAGTKGYRIVAHAPEGATEIVRAFSRRRHPVAWLYSLPDNAPWWGWSETPEDRFASEPRFHVEQFPVRYVDGPLPRAESFRCRFGMGPGRVFR